MGNEITQQHLSQLQTQMPLISTAKFLCTTRRMQLKRHTVTKTWRHGGKPQIKLSAGEITIVNIKIIIKPVNEATRWVIMTLGGSKAFWTMLKKLHFSLMSASLIAERTSALWVQYGRFLQSCCLSLLRWTSADIQALCGEDVAEHHRIRDGDKKHWILFHSSKFVSCSGPCLRMYWIFRHALLYFCFFFQKFIIELSQLL